MQPSRLRSFCAPIFLSVLVLASQGALAQATGEATLPEWDRLSPQQRELLVAPIRERWNARPEHRQHMLERARDLQRMTPEQRRDARQGVKRWRHMTPEQRAGMRALYGRMRSLDEAGRRELRERWRAMTPEQRRAWVRENPPPPRDEDR